MDTPVCAKCDYKFCHRGVTDPKVLPDFCPMKLHRDVIEESLREYDGDMELRKLYVNATICEYEAYDTSGGRFTPVRPRVRELIEFAKKIGVEKIGIAFCIGLSREARALTEVLESHGFKVYSALCKCGAVDKVKLHVPAEYKLRGPDKFEAACNPVLQARLLNMAGTQLNVIVGLCIGHDIIFTRYSKAPVTTLIVKDRLTGHNPAVALYTYYHRAYL